MPHGNNNNKNIKICAHTGLHGILGLGTSRSPRMSAPSLLHSRFVLNCYQGKQWSLFLSTKNFFNFEHSGFNMGSGPTSPQEPLYHTIYNRVSILIIVLRRVWFRVKCLKHNIKHRDSALNRIGKSATLLLNRVMVWEAGPHLPTQVYIEYSRVLFTGLRYSFTELS